jgi:hypothetical protein
MGAYPTAPSPYAGTSLLSQWLDPTTRYLFNQPPPAAPPTTTTTLPPDPGYGAAAAAPQPNLAQSYAQNFQAAGSIDPATLFNDPRLRHGAYGELRGLDQMLRGGIAPEHLYPFIQSLMDQGVLYPGEGGVGLSTALPWGGPQAPKTQRLIDMYERYQDYLNAGNSPTRWPTAQVAPPGRYDPSQGPRILGTMP